MTCAQCKADERVPKSSYCRTCKNERWRKWWAETGSKDPKHVERRRRRNGQYNFVDKLARNYGLSLEQYNAIVSAQGGRCAICRFDAPLQVDHDHTDGRVRGLLCGPCNRGLAFFRDNPIFLEAAVRYLSGGQT